MYDYLFFGMSQFRVSSDGRHLMRKFGESQWVEFMELQIGTCTSELSRHLSIYAITHLFSATMQALSKCILLQLQYYLLGFGLEKRGNFVCQTERWSSNIQTYLGPSHDSHKSRFSSMT